MNTAKPLPQRRPVISAQPAARTAPPMIANQAAVPYPNPPAAGRPRTASRLAPVIACIKYTAATMRAATPSAATT